LRVVSLEGQAALERLADRRLVVDDQDALGGTVAFRGGGRSGRQGAHGSGSSLVGRRSKGARLEAFSLARGRRAGVRAGAGPARRAAGGALRGARPRPTPGPQSVAPARSFARSAFTVSTGMAKPRPTLPAAEESTPLGEYIAELIPMM